MSMPESSQPTIAAYATSESPITSSMVAKMSVSKDDVIVDPLTGSIYCIEKRPEEGGRDAIVSVADGLDVFGPPWNARTAVHEYGGAPAVVYDNVVLFSNLSDGQVYKVNMGVQRASPTQVTAVAHARFANFACHPCAPNLVVCIMEDHTKPAPKDVVNSLVCLNTQSSNNPMTIRSGSDFYASPCFNSDGTLLAWTEWSHPDMPWDGEQVFVAAVDINRDHLSLAPHRLAPLRVAGRPSAVSAVQPTWLTDTTLLFSCDVSGYHNPWIAALDAHAKTFTSHPVFEQTMPLDFVDPSWLLGGSNIAVLDEHSALFAATRDGRTVLYIVGADGSWAEVAAPFVHVVCWRRVAHRQVVFLGSKVDKGPAIVLCSFLDSSDSLSPTFTTLDGKNASADAPVSEALITLPVPMSLLVETSDGPLPLHLVCYPPKNPSYKGRDDEKPPAIVNVHGGPTHIVRQTLSLEKQFFTSRGWFWIDINYSGSSNYGRKYIDRLKGNWGVADVRDCVQAIRQLSSPKHSLIDAARVVIRGGSAGGYTTLAALSQRDPALSQRDPALQVFAAGTSSYGVSDLRRMTEITHKFQSWYVQTLVGGTPEEIPEVYRARSPVFHAQNIKAPLLILQGSKDRIVPPNQAEDMVNVIREGGGTTEYVLFDGESHGWRRAETIAKALDLELDFYSRVPRVFRPRL
ncbi:alpha/beta-hydrolase [Mycena pura]|uniref:Alpha/beta-hydrolase n=1 Tax=Mycena pura TaxID=153505 RepID=A0AAD6YDG5_9AGAR|nr:alpha/beta-hydrolase [Mycena pura]